MPDDLPYGFRAGDELTARIVDGLLRDRWRWRHASGDSTVDVSFADSDLPPIFAARASAVGATTYIQITGTANATFGGYSWQQVAWRPALYVTAAGTGYSSGTVTFTPTYASGSDAPTATYDVDATTGALIVVNITHAGSKMAALTASVSGGSGATLACILDQGALTGGGWIDFGASGAVGANDSHGNPTPGDLAYEASGVTSLGARVADSGGYYYHEAVYPAVRDAGGRLLFFCSASVLAKTKAISAYPSSVNVFYGMEPLEISGSSSPGAAGLAVEGASALISGLGTTFYAYNFGTSVPPVGSYLVCGMVASAYGPFWAFRYDA